MRCQGFTVWLVENDHPSNLSGAFFEWLKSIGAYQGEAYTNVYDVYTPIQEPREDRWGGFPPLEV